MKSKKQMTDIELVDMLIKDNMISDKNEDKNDALILWKLMNGKYKEAIKIEGGKKFVKNLRETGGLSEDNKVIVDSDWEENAGINFCLLMNMGRGFIARVDTSKSKKEKEK